MNKRHLNRIVNESIRRVISESEGDKRDAMDHLNELSDGELINLYNEWEINKGNGEVFDDMSNLNQYNVLDVLKAIYYSKSEFNPYDDYFRFDDLERLESWTEKDAAEHILSVYEDELCEFVIEEGLID